MDVAYWNEKAQNYDNEIFNVWHRDRDGALEAFFQNEIFRCQTAIDCGCGIGHGLPVLARQFHYVHAVDISEDCLAAAKERFQSLPNIQFASADLSSPRTRLPRADLAVAVNSVITPSIHTRLKMLKTIHRHLPPEGTLVLVVPSLESYSYAAYKRTEWSLREGTRVCPRFREDAIRRGHGVVPIDGVLTKHYLKEELMTFLELAGFKSERVEKIRYDWDTEYENPPEWMRDPYPWDWMCVARKVFQQKKGTNQ